MGAEDQQFDRVLRRFRRRLRFAGEAAGEGCDPGVVAVAAVEGDPEVAAVRRAAGGDRDGAQAEEVAERRVGAEPPIDVDRVGLDLRDRRLERRGGEEQRIDGLELGVRLRFVTLQPLEIGDVVGRSDLFADRISRLTAGSISPGSAASMKAPTAA